jgi:hypothetical protein
MGLFYILWKSKTLLDDFNQVTSPTSEAHQPLQVPRQHFIVLEQLHRHILTSNINNTGAHNHIHITSFNIHFGSGISAEALHACRFAIA